MPKGTQVIGGLPIRRIRKTGEMAHGYGTRIVSKERESHGHHWHFVECALCPYQPGASCSRGLILVQTVSTRKSATQIPEYAYE
ncbi:MAG: hypothetical protein V2G51_02380 [bacterium JZ-2024 1]